MGKDFESLIKYLKENLKIDKSIDIFAKVNEIINGTVCYDYEILKCYKDRKNRIFIYSYTYEENVYPSNSYFLSFWVLPSCIENYLNTGTLIS